MKIDDCFELGSVIKPHGLKGAVSIYIDADDPGYYSALDAVFLQLGSALVPHFVESIDRKSVNQFKVKFEGVESEEAANLLRKAKIFLPLAALPKLSGNKFYFHEIIGFTLVDESFGEVGEIVEVLEYPGNILARAMHNEKEVLAPINDQTIIKLDREKKTFLVNVPEGLIDMYLSDEGEEKDDNWA